MNDKNFIEELRQKREEYGVTQTRLAVACGISREYYNRIEKGKQPLNDELREVIEKQIERFNPQEPLFLLIDYFRVRFPTTDALAITKTSESYVMRADLYAKGVNAAEEVLPGIKNDLLLGKFKPRETDVAAVARASPEERREKAEQLRVIPEKKPKADKESARSGTKHRQEAYVTIGKSYEDMKDSKRVTEDSALVSLRYTARNMVETCDVLFTNFPGLLEKPDYKDQVIEIMQEPKQYILKLEGETDNEQHEDTLQADGGQQPGFGDSRCIPAQAEHRACGKDRGRVQ